MRVDGQGYELAELSGRELIANAARRRCRPARSCLTGRADEVSNRIRHVIYYVVTEEMGEELFEKLRAQYADDENVTVIMERRRSSRRGPGGPPGEPEVRVIRDRRRRRIVGELPDSARRVVPSGAARWSCTSTAARGATRARLRSVWSCPIRRDRS